MEKELILRKSSKRYALFPIKYNSLWQLYKKSVASFWTAEEIDFSADKEDWSNLSNDEKYFIEHILAFFANSDAIVLENLFDNFATEVQIPEARAFYSFQEAIESIHNEVYNLLIETLIKDNEKKKMLFNAIETMPVIKKKAAWAQKWMNKEIPFVERLIAFAIFEGVYFSGSFCAIFWLKSRKKMVKALGHSNELIARDEGMHCQFAIELFHLLENKPSQKRMYEILVDAVDIEKEFICEILPCRLLGMNSNLMKQYIEFVADRLLKQLGYNAIYNSENPFDFMNNINLTGKTNFFEKRVSEYQLATMTDNSNNRTFEINDDF